MGSSWAAPLEVTQPEAVQGNFNHVYTEGLTIREVALKLRAAGAIEVSEVVLARQSYGGAPPEQP